MGAPSKPIEMLDPVSGDVIKRWPGGAVAGDQLGIGCSHISQCCYGRKKTAGGYGWRFAEPSKRHPYRPRLAVELTDGIHVVTVTRADRQPIDHEAVIDELLPPLTAYGYHEAL